MPFLSSCLRNSTSNTTHAESTPLVQHNNRDVVSGNPEGAMFTTMARRSATFTVRFVMLLLFVTATAATVVMITSSNTETTATAPAATTTTTFQASMAVVNDAWPYLYDSSTDPSSSTTAECHPGTEPWECDGIVHCLPCFSEGLADLLHDVCVRGPTLTPAGGDDPCAATWSTRMDRYYVDEEGMGAHT